MNLQFPRRGMLRLGAMVIATSLLAACAQPPRAPDATRAANTNSWSGRLSLVVDDPSAQSLHAAFELQGSADAGQLTLLNPLGNVMASLHWSPGQAELATGSERRTSDSLAMLVRQLTGSDLPIPALFDWMRGNATAVAGWQADVSGIADGRLVAQRLVPQPAATLRIIFSR